jgi:phenylacetate-CoA ligase
MITCRSDRSRIAQGIERRIDGILRYSYAHIPFYREAMQRVSMDPSRGPLTSDDLLKLPTTSKETIVSDFARLLSLGKELTVSPRTSGTSLKPSGTIVWGHRNADLMSALRLRMNFITGVGLMPKIAKPVFERDPNAVDVSGYGRVRNFIALPHSGHEFTLRPVYMRIHLDEMERTAREMIRRRVDTLSGRPSLALAFAETFARMGEMPDLKSYLSYGEVLSARDRREIARALGVQVRELYGCGELGGLGVECGNRVIHMHSDQFYLEVLRGGRRVGPGDWGELVVTALDNPEMPLIRYATGDLVRLDANQRRCECGLTLLRASAVLGRKDDSLVNSSGNLVPQRMVMDALEEGLDLRHYQVTQESRRSVLVRVSEERHTRQTEVDAKRILSDLLGGDVDIDVHPWTMALTSTRARPTVRLAP